MFISHHFCMRCDHFSFERIGESSQCKDLQDSRIYEKLSNTKRNRPNIKFSAPTRKCTDHFSLMITEYRQLHSHKWLKIGYFHNCKSIEMILFYNKLGNHHIGLQMSQRSAAITMDRSP